MRSILRILCILVFLVGVDTSEAANPLASWSDDGWESFPIVPGGDPILLPVQVSGQLYPFLLDSGATHHMFDISLRKLLGKTIGPANVAGNEVRDVRLEKAHSPHMLVGTFDVPSSAAGTVLLFDFAQGRQRMEQDVQGLLAAPFFRDKLVQIDFDRSVLRIATRDRASADLGTAFPLRLSKAGIPWVDNVRVGGRNESFIVGTGINYTLQVHKWLFQALCEDGQLEVVEGTSTGEDIAGSNRVSRGRLASFSFGDYRHRDLLVHEAGANAIGLTYLARYVVTIDVTGERIYLRPGMNFSQADNVDCTEFKASKIDGVLAVASVEEGTPADLGGLRRGDKIIGVNGIACQRMRLMEFNQQLRDSAGKKLTLKMDREGALLEVTLDVQTRPETRRNTPRN